MTVLTIGEVLNRLKDEFQDVTISKIRFLEAEGLISPDRTDSGYRQFTPADIERLRYVLRAQRDRYLPLKVIREELDRIDAGLAVEQAPPGPDPGAAERLQAVTGPADGTEPGHASIVEDVAPHVDLSIEELAGASGLDPATVRELRDHGLLRGEDRFDGEDLRAARIAAELLATGLEPRHLRMFRQFADREAALYEQLVTPLLRQRNPDSRQAAAEQLDRLVRHGARLHRALLGHELRTTLRP